MKGLQMVMKNELLKLSVQRKYRFLIILSILTVLGAALVSFLPGSVLQFNMNNFPYTVLSAVTFLLIPVAAFLSASDLLAGEMEQGRLKIALTQPISRFAILLGKWLAMIVYTAVLMICSAVLAAIICVLAGGWGTLQVDTLLLAIMVTLIPTAMICAWSLFIAGWFHTATASFMANLLIYGGLILLGLAVSSLNMILPTSYMSIYKMVLGSHIPWSNLITGLAILIGYTAVFASAASLRFEWQEI